MGHFREWATDASDPDELSLKASLTGAWTLAAVACFNAVVAPGSLFWLMPFGLSAMFFVKGYRRAGAFTAALSPLPPATEPGACRHNPGAGSTVRRWRST